MEQHYATVGEPGRLYGIDELDKATPLLYARLMDQANCIDDLEKAIYGMRERLAPILSARETASMDSEQPLGPSAPGRISDRIRDNNGRLNQLVDDLLDIGARLEI